MVGTLFQNVRDKKPLVHNITNYVTVNDCANITLAIGASPIMADDIDEVEDIVSICNGLNINIGTLNKRTIESMIAAGKKANELNKPVILDPVGVFATKTRTDFTNKLLNKIKFDVVKGNVAEIKFIGGLDVRGQGVDSFDDGEDISEVIKKIAKKLGCIVVATGKSDFISDGNTVIKIFNGTSKLKSVTGTGCMTGSLIGSYLGAYNNLEGRERDNFKKVEAVAMGVLTMAVSGELADKDNIAIGTFKEELMNNVYEMNIDKLKEYGRIE